MNRLTQHSKTTMFTDSDVMVEGQRLGPAAFAGLSYYRHYVKIINRLAELEDRFCNEPQTRADRIRAMTDDEELAEFLKKVGGCGPSFDKKYCNNVNGCPEGINCWMEWLRQEDTDGAAQA